MRCLTFFSFAIILTGCADRATQAHILARAKAEVAARENWADQAYIRIEKSPREDYMMWKDLSWTVKAGAYDYSGYPKYNGIKLHPGSEREMTFSRDGCLTGYENKTPACRRDPYATTWTDTVAEPVK